MDYKVMYTLSRSQDTAMYKESVLQLAICLSLNGRWRPPGMRILYINALIVALYTNTRHG
jgi:hypothetical protein